ncbi:MAG: hypothetical protein ABI907_07120, partial [Ramlibacter sp.]
FKGHLTTRFADCLVDHDVVVLQDGNLFVVRMTRLKAVNTTKFSEVAWCAGVAVTLKFPNTAAGTGTIEFAAGGEELGRAQFSY